MKSYSISRLGQVPARHNIRFGIGEAKPGKDFVNLGKVKNVAETWEQLLNRLRKVHRTSETLEQFLKLPRGGIGGQDALKASAGFWTGCPCKGGSRQYANLLPRSIVTADLDSLTPEGLEKIAANLHALRNYAWFAHTTRKHTHDHPRLRLVILLARPVPTELYEPVARFLLNMIDPGLKWTDAVSFRPTQLMYFPTASADNPFETFGGPGDQLVDWTVLFENLMARKVDPHDVRNWPRKQEEDTPRSRQAKAEDPWEKPGIIGAFCRTHPIEDLIAEHFSALYAPGDPNSADTRYSWLHGGTSNGLVIYEDGRFATSHHSSDPIAGLSVNAWDFARLVKFGEEEDTDAAMMAWARALPKVQDMQAEDRDAAFEEEEPHVGEVLSPERPDPWSGLDADDLAILGPSTASVSAGLTREQEEALDDDDRAVLGLSSSRTIATREPDRLPAMSKERARADGATVGSDAWAGRRFAKRTFGRLLYESVSKKWLGWTGERWAGLTDEDVAREAKEAAAAMFASASAKTLDDPKAHGQELGRILKRYGDESARGRMVEAARSEDGMHIHGPTQFDRNPMALTVANGILDLNTGRCRPALPSDRVSKLAGCSFEPDALSPRWDAFLERILPDPEVRAFLQRFAGYGLTGSVEEEVFILLHGSGANGKSVFCEVYDALLAEMRGAFGAVLVTKSKHENEAARLVNKLPGLRAAFVNETSIGDVFDSQRVKELSSRDKIAARALYAEAYDFAPTHKLWIRTNHLPGSLDAGDGFWRRCIPVGFGVQIPEAERDKGLARRVIAEELPGVLNWALAGCREWQRAGLRIPASIEAERRTYREDTDLLGQWLEECTDSQPDARLKVGVAFQSFAEFCRDQGASAGTALSLSKALKGRGFKPDPSRTHGRRFIGLSLRMPDRSDDFEE